MVPASATLQQSAMEARTGTINWSVKKLDTFKKLMIHKYTESISTYLKNSLMCSFTVKSNSISQFNWMWYLASDSLHLLQTREGNQLTFRTSITPSFVYSNIRILVEIKVCGRVT